MHPGGIQRKIYFTEKAVFTHSFFLLTLTAAEKSSSDESASPSFVLSKKAVLMVALVMPVVEWPPGRYTLALVFQVAVCSLGAVLNEQEKAAAVDARP